MTAVDAVEAPVDDQYTVFVATVDDVVNVLLKKYVPLPVAVMLIS